MRVLVVEDDRNLAASLGDALRGEGIFADVVHDGVAALGYLKESDVDVVLLDRDLPRLNGDSVCRNMRASGNSARVLMLTAAGSVADRVTGLDIGADDYLVKPFAYLELLARIRALARREGSAPAPVREWGTLRIDSARRIAERDGMRLRLSAKEFELLEALIAADGGFVSRVDLLDAAWDDPDELSSGVLKVAIHSLRRKLGDPPVVCYSPGLGYRLAPEREGEQR